MNEIDDVLKKYTKVTTLSASSRASIKVRDSYYTVEYYEERSVSPETSPDVLDDIRDGLWNVVNTECDNQIKEILNFLDKPHKK